MHPATLASRHFSFTDSWVVPGSPERVRDVLIDLERYPEWWPQVVAVAKIDDDNARVLCRAALPYTLDICLTAVSRELPTVRVDLAGDLAGWASWTLTSAPGGTRLDFAQEVDLVGVPAWLTGVTRPLLSWNHQQMMRGAQRGLIALRWPA